MSRKSMAITIVAIAVLAALFFHARLIFGETQPVLQVEPVVPQNAEITHRQEVWIHALEWCESRGIPSAVNKVDRDGTPSYYSFQFKPGTFKAYMLRYNLLPAERLDTQEEIMLEIKKYENQYAILTHMMGDPTVNWRNEFPDCIRIKIGMPPIDNKKTTP